MLSTSINSFSAIARPEVRTTIQLKEWFDQIRYSEYSEVIKYTRDGATNYSEIKHSLPCVCYNFTFNGYRENRKIIESTGILYIDVDKETFSLEQLDRQKIFACYKSFGGKGYCVLVKVEGVSKENFDSTYMSIIKELDLIDYYDKNAKKANQCSVLSYDPEIFVNENAPTFHAIAPPPSVYVSCSNITKDRGAPNTNIRYDDLDKIGIENDYIVNWEGFEYVRCFIPYSVRIKVGNRNSFLLSYCANLIYLNPQLPRQSVIDILDKVNKIACEQPVARKQVEDVVNSIFKQVRSGTLKPILYNKKRKIVFTKTCGYDAKAKLQICRTEYSKRQRSESLEKLRCIINNWDFQIKGKITQRKIYQDKSLQITKKTVEKYWPEWKSLIAHYNNFNGLLRVYQSTDSYPRWDLISTLRQGGKAA